MWRIISYPLTLLAVLVILENPHWHYVYLQNVPEKRRSLDKDGRSRGLNRKGEGASDYDKMSTFPVSRGGNNQVLYFIVHSSYFIGSYT